MKSILITGCSTGIGLHCAKRLKEDGWRVFATARKKDDIEMLTGLGLTGLYLDYTEPQSIASVFKQVMDQTEGRLDALFNNGAYGQAGAVEDLPTDVLRAQFEANFFGWHELTNRVLPIMRKQGFGRIVHCSSVLGFVPSAWRGAYNASKFALEGLASTMRLELRDQKDIHVALIEPGPIESEFTSNGLSHFVNNIDIEGSVHSEAYKDQLIRLKSNGGVNRFRLGPEAVYKRLKHALNSNRPKAHYYVTFPTYFSAFIKRVLPQSLIDKVLAKGS